MAELKAISKLNKADCLAELEELSKTVEYEEGEFDENTPVAELRKLVKEGREADNADDEGDGESTEGGKGVADGSPPTTGRLSQSETAEETSKSKVVASEKGDYLQKYQCKKITVDGKTYHAVGGKETDPEPGSKAEKMKENLLAQERISTIIYPEPGSAAVIPFTINLNGYRLDFPTNTWLEMPKQCAAVARKSQQQKIEATDIPEKIDPEHVSKALQG